MNRAPEHARRMALDTLTYTAQGPVLDALIKTASLSQADRSEICAQAAGSGAQHPQPFRPGPDGGVSG